MMLNDKVAVIYGAGGAIGGAVARAFAAQGAKLFLTGRHLAQATAAMAKACRHRLSNAETIERLHRVREESDSCADRVDARGPLQHDNLIARPAQGDRGTQSGDPSPDDDHAHR
jgi:NAD(P)-dependent dehydrogenase (short-subunit alcohol dehydrogenase family)